LPLLLNDGDPHRFGGNNSWSGKDGKAEFHRRKPPVRALRPSRHRPRPRPRPAGSGTVARPPLRRDRSDSLRPGPRSPGPRSPGGSPARSSRPVPRSSAPSLARV